MTPSGLAGWVRRSPILYSLWHRLKRTAVVRAIRRPGVSPRALKAHAEAARTGDPSYAGEAAHLCSVLFGCGLHRGFVVDLAAGDGVTDSSTLVLFRDPGWRGLAIEMDDRRFARLAHAYRQFENASVLQRKVTPTNVAAVLTDHGVPARFEVLNLDIDSYDLFVADAILQAFRPGIITMEINEKIPPPLYFSVLFDPDHLWREDHFYGCSLVAASELVKPFGYVLESVQYNNAFFVRDDLAEGRFNDLPEAVAYDQGYRMRPDRADLFPWNRDMDDLLELAPERAAERLRERFRRYSGRFVLEVRGARDESGRGFGTHDGGRTFP